MSTRGLCLSLSELPKFSGAQEEDFNVFIRKLESILRLLHIPENEHIDVLTLCLNGAALRAATWRCPGTYHEMVAVLSNTFCDPPRFVVKMTRCVQEHGESLFAYYSRTLEQLDRGGILDAELRKTFFVNGLKGEIRNLTAIAARDCDVNGAYKAAQQFESVHNNRKASPYTRDAPGNVGARKCWECGDASHIAYKCPIRRARKAKNSAQ